MSDALIKHGVDRMSAVIDCVSYIEDHDVGDENPCVPPMWTTRMLPARALTLRELATMHAILLRYRDADWLLYSAPSRERL